MRKIIFNSVLLVIFVPLLVYADVDGQAVFDSVWWTLMKVFCIGISVGLAIKMINRS